MKNATLFVDFDHVLFNTENFKKELTPLAFPREIARFLYEDAASFLKHAGKHFDLILFTEGEEDFQKEKLEKSGILRLAEFREVIVLPSETKAQKIPELMKTYQNRLLLIDDKPENVEAAIDAGLAVIRVKRGKYSEQETAKKAIFEVNSLKEIAEKKILEKWLKI